MTNCADCGVEVEPTLDGRWVSQVEFGRSYVCRATHKRITDPFGRWVTRLISADYHHIKGERQKHWPLDTEPQT